MMGNAAAIILALGLVYMVFYVVNVKTISAKRRHHVFLVVSLMALVIAALASGAFDIWDQPDVTVQSKIVRSLGGILDVAMSSGVFFTVTAIVAVIYMIKGRRKAAKAKR